MRVTAEDAENSEDAEVQRRGRHFRKLLRLAQSVKATDGTA